MKENTEALRHNGVIRYMIGACVLAMGFIWLNTFFHMNSFYEAYDEFSFLQTAVAAVMVGGLIYWGLYSTRDDLPKVTTKLCVKGITVFAVWMFLLFVLEINGTSFSVYGETSVRLLWFELPKTYLYDFWMIVVFPYMISIVFRALRREQVEKISVLYSAVTVAVFSLAGILIFRPLSAVYQLDAILMNCITLGAAVWKYVLPEQKVGRIKAFAAVLLYAVLRISLLPLQCTGWSLSLGETMMGDAYAPYVEKIRVIASNASFWGTSEYLRNSTEVHEYLLGQNKPLLQLLYYGGWAAVIVFVAAMAFFAWMLVKLIGRETGRKHQGWLTYVTAAGMLGIRAVFGVLYGAGFPYPIAFPFMGSRSVVDGVALTLLILCAWEHRRILQVEATESTFVPAEEVVGKQDLYMVLDAQGNPCENEEDEDAVRIVLAQGGSLCCEAEWYSMQEREFCVFAFKTSLLNRKRFILEYSGKKWVPLKDPDGSIRKGIIERCREGCTPDYMEEKGGSSYDEEMDDWDC